MSMPRTLSVLAAAALALATSAVAHASDDDPAPKKRTIKLETHATAEKGSPRSPMPVIETWLRRKLGASMTAAGEDPMGAMLEQWFEGDDDVPMADLRDALRAEGWNAESMRAWMMGAMARAAARPPMAPRRGMHGHHDHPGRHRGDGRQRGHGRPHGHDRQPGHGRFRAHGPRRGMRGGPGARWRMHGGFRAPHGPHGPHGPHRGGHGMGGHGMGGHGMGGPAWGRTPFGGVPFGGRAIGGRPHGHVQQRAFLYWNDGTGWKHRELPGGANPFGGGRGPHPLGGQAPFEGQAPHGHAEPHPRPGMGGRAPDAPGQPGGRGGAGRVMPRPPAAPGAGGMPVESLERLQRFLEQMKKGGLDPNVGGASIDDADMGRLLELLEQLGGSMPAPDAPKPPRRKVKVRVAHGEGVVKLRPVERDDR